MVDFKFILNIKNKNLSMSEIKRLIYQAHSITGELIPESESTMSPEMELPAQDFEHLEAIRNETQTMHDVIEKHEVCVEPEPLTCQPVKLHAEPTIQLTEESMVQAVLNLIDSFNLTYIGKLNLFTATREKMSEIKHGKPVSWKLRIPEREETTGQELSTLKESGRFRTVEHQALFIPAEGKTWILLNGSR